MGGRRDEDEKEGQRAKTRLEERAEGTPVSRTRWQPGAGRHTLSAPPPAASGSPRGRGRPRASGRGERLPPSPYPRFLPPGEAAGVPLLIPFLPAWSLREEPVAAASPRHRCPLAALASCGLPSGHPGRRGGFLPSCTHADTSLRQLVSIPRCLQNKREAGL